MNVKYENGFVCLLFVWSGLFGFYLCLFGFGLRFVGGARLFLFRETPAQFAVYKSPEQGLNLSRS